MIIGALIGLFVGLLRLWFGIIEAQKRIDRQIRYGLASSGKIKLSISSFIFPLMAAVLGAIIGYFVA
jgi:hypothetical protein